MPLETLSLVKLGLHSQCCLLVARHLGSRLLLLVWRVANWMNTLTFWTRRLYQLPKLCYLLQTFVTIQGFLFKKPTLNPGTQISVNRRHIWKRRVRLYCPDSHLMCCLNVNLTWWIYFFFFVMETLERQSWWYNHCIWRIQISVIEPTVHASSDDSFGGVLGYSTVQCGTYRNLLL